MPLEMRIKCEKCELPLSLDAEAYICSFECTFCAKCTLAMNGRCPNCSGELLRRPKRKSEVCSTEESPNTRGISV
jgi:uncharacterized protein